jgi:TRAP-type C4-dicarboxylate transport system permease small subunit
MSVAKAAVPPSARRFAAVAAANTLIYASFAMLWFGSAFGGFTVVGRRALGEDSPVLAAATTVALYAIVDSGFLLPFSLVLVAFRSMASVSNNTSAKEVLYPLLNTVFWSKPFTVWEVRPLNQVASFPIKKRVP